MLRASPHTVGFACVLLAAGASGMLPAERSRPRAIDAALWFDPVTYASPRLGGPLAAGDLRRIEATARSEILQAFAGLRFSLADRPGATYQVRVAQDVRDERFRRDVGVAGQSRAAPGLGGYGAVSFSFLASGAMVYAPEDAPREELVEAIGRGIGRTAVHEFTHQLLPKVAIDASTDIQSFEYRSAARHEQYFGTMRWDVAWPLLQAWADR